MVRYLGPTLSANAILVKLDSLDSMVSIFVVMMQGFYRESQGRNESVVHYVARLEGTLNELQVKHLYRFFEL